MIIIIIDYLALFGYLISHFIVKYFLKNIYQEIELMLMYA
jgi:hypothetical protein